MSRQNISEHYPCQCPYRRKESAYIGTYNRSVYRIDDYRSRSRFYYFAKQNAHRNIIYDVCSQKRSYAILEFNGVAAAESGCYTLRCPFVG